MGSEVVDPTARTDGDDVDTDFQPHAGLDRPPLVSRPPEQPGPGEQPRPFEQAQSLDRPRPDERPRPIDQPRQQSQLLLFPWQRPEIAQWLAQRRNAGDTPADIANVLVGSGWDADSAADTAIHSLRRSDRHRVLYGAMCWSIGLGALGLATGLHQVLSDTFDHDARVVAAFSFTIAVILLPLAAFCTWSAKQTEATSPHAVWSPTRRMWFGTLAACTATVGLIRLVIYVYRMVAAMTGARYVPLTPSDQFQVVVSLAIAVPLFVWSFVEWRRSDVVISGLRERAS